MSIKWSKTGLNYHCCWHFKGGCISIEEFLGGVRVLQPSAENFRDPPSGCFWHLPLWRGPVCPLLPWLLINRVNDRTTNGLSIQVYPFRSQEKKIIPLHAMVGYWRHSKVQSLKWYSMLNYQDWNMGRSEPKQSYPILSSISPACILLFWTPASEQFAEVILEQKAIILKHAFIWGEEREMRNKKD